MLGSKGECECGRVKALFCLDISEYSILFDSASIKPSRSLNESELNFFPTSVFSQIVVGIDLAFMLNSFTLFVVEKCILSCVL